MKKVNIEVVESTIGGKPNWGEFAEGFCAGFALVSFGTIGGNMGRVVTFAGRSCSVATLVNALF